MHFNYLILMLIIIIEISWIIQYIYDPDNFTFSYLPIFIGFAAFLIYRKLNNLFIKNEYKKESKIDKIRSLGKRVKSGELVNFEDCPICLEEMKKLSSLAITNCSHIYHIHCINKWRSTHTDCPLCRTEICMERELPVSKKPENLFSLNYFNNSFSNLENENKIVVNFGSEYSYVVDENDNCIKI